MPSIGRMCVLALVLVSVGIFERTPTASAEHGGIEIVKIRFNPPGPDDGSRRSLNDEYIFIRNTSSHGQGLRGWRIHDARSGNSYRIDSRTRLAPGDKLYLYTGPGPNLIGSCVDADCPRTYFYHWDKDDYVWDNEGDTATVRRNDGSVVDRCRYSKADTSPAACGS